MQETLKLILEQLNGINGKVTELDKKLTDIEEKFTQKFAEVDKRFAEVDEKFETLYKVMDQRFAEVDEKFETLYKVMDQRFAEVEAKFIETHIIIDEKFKKFTQDISNELRAIVNAVESHEFKIKRTLNNHYNENIKNYKSHGMRLSRLEVYQQKIKYAVAQLNQEVIN